MKLEVGSVFPNISIETILGRAIAIPDEGVKYWHLQFRRFAGCPICNFHLHTLAKRSDDIKALGITEVIFFHSSKEEMLEYQDQLPFDCVADPTKTYYKKFGVETSWLGVFHPSAMWSGLLNILRTRKVFNKAENGVFGLPADFLIDASGRIVALNYGRHADDNWSFEDLQALRANAG